MVSHGDDATDLNIILLYDLHPTWEPHEIEEMVTEVNLMQAALHDVGHTVQPLALWDDKIEILLSPFRNQDFVVFNWSDGIPGVPRSYDMVAGTLESLGFAYTGSSREALAFNDDKRLVKALLDRSDIPTPRWHVFEVDNPDGWDCFPAIVKPALEHCSLGLGPESIVTNSEELQQRITHVQNEFQQPALVEDFIDGREFPVWLWGDGTVEMLPLLEWDFSPYPDLHQRLLDFDSKFCPNKHEVAFSVAQLGQAELKQLEEIVVAAYHLLGCRDYGRLDVRLRDGVFYVLDVNANPDIAANNSLATACKLAGYSYGQMASRLVNLAWRRSRH